MALFSALTSVQTREGLALCSGLSTACALLAAASLSRDEPADKGRSARSQAIPTLLHPLVFFAVLCALLLANQLLVNVYLLRSHRGDPSYVTRYLGPGWFALWTGSAPVRWLAAALPRWLVEEVLPLSILRVNSVLELPFSLFAYLGIVALLDEGVYRRLLRGPHPFLAAISFSTAFSLVELRLWNPWTEDDLLGRVLGVMATGGAVLLLRRAHRGEPASLSPAPRDALGLLVFLAGAGALAALVLGLYDVTLLYNLGHLPRLAPAMSAAAGVAGLAFLLRHRRAPEDWSALGARAPGLLLVTHVLCAFAALFFVPSMAIRYCGDGPAAWMPALLVGVASLILGSAIGARALRARGVPLQRAAPGVLAFLVVGAALAGADATGHLLPGASPALEVTLLRVSVLLLVPGVIAAGVVESLLRPAA